MNPNPYTGRPAQGYEPLPKAEQYALCPRVLPYPWYENRSQGMAGVYDSDRMRVILSAAREEDGKRWLHLSVSRRDGRIPTWDEIVKVKDIFAGAEALAVHVVPRRSEHYDAVKAGHVPGPLEVLHLWVCLDGDPVPNFLRARGGTL